MWASPWLAGLVALVCAASTYSSVELTTFVKITEPNYSAPTIGDPWAAPQLLSCVRTCRDKFTSCYSVTYNILTGTCTPQSRITYTPTISSRSDNDLLYYSDFCDKKLGFRLYIHQQEILCLFVSSELVTFSKARETCAGKNSTLYIVDSSEKLDLLRKVVRSVTASRTWIGLSDLVTEGVFVWEDGQFADVSFPVPWRGGQPDDAGGREDCVEMGSRSDFKYVNDQYCGDMAYFICE